MYLLVTFKLLAPDTQRSCQIAVYYSYNDLRLHACDHLGHLSSISKLGIYSGNCNMGHIEIY